MWLKKKSDCFSIIVTSWKIWCCHLVIKGPNPKRFFQFLISFFTANTIIVQNFTNRCIPCANLKLSLAICSVFCLFPAKSTSSSINICCPLRLYKHRSSDLLASLNVDLHSSAGTRLSVSVSEEGIRGRFIHIACKYQLHHATSHFCINGGNPFTFPASYNKQLAIVNGT